MPRNGSATREKILAAAHELVMASGFGATSIDRVIADAGVTKGTFFYHFPTKIDLAHALVQRYISGEEALLLEALEWAERSSTDPLQQLLGIVDFYIELLDAAGTPNPGCLMASFCYQSELVDDQTRDSIRDAILHSRVIVRRKLDDVVLKHTPRIEADLDDLADEFLSAFEGGFVLERALAQPGVIVSQLRQYRNYVQLLFSD